MASAKHPCIVLNCGEVDGIRCTAEVGPFDTALHAEETARELARIYPGSIAFIDWAGDDRNPDPAMLQAQLERARHRLAQLRA